MKTPIILTGLVAIFGSICNGLINFYYSPISGTATAQQLNDTIEAYTWAKFVRDGHLYSTLTFFCYLVIILIWVSWFYSNKQNKNTKNETK